MRLDLTQREFRATAYGAQSGVRIMSVTYFRLWLSENFDQSFPCILASIKTGDRPWRLFYALHEVLGIGQSSITNPLGRSRDALFEPIYLLEPHTPLLPPPLPP